MTFTPDGKTLAVAAKDFVKNEPVHSVKLFDVATGKEVRKIEAVKGVPVSSVAITPDGKLLVYGAGNDIHLYDLHTGKKVRRITDIDGIHMLVFSPDGKMLAVRGLNQRVRLWDMATGNEVRQLNDAELPRRGGGWFVIASIEDSSGPEMRAIAFSADSKRIVSAAGGTVRVWETATGKEVALVESHWRAPSTIVLSADGKTVVTWGDDRVVRRWDSATGKSLGVFPAPHRTTLAAFSRDGRTVALANEDGSIRLHDTTTGKELARFKGPATGTLALAFAPGGKVLAARGNGDNTVRLYEVASKKEIRQLVIRPKTAMGRQRFVVFLNGGDGQPGTGPGLLFSPDGKVVATPLGIEFGRSKGLVFLDAATGKELRRIETSQPIASYAFSPDSRTVATEYANGTITLWEVASGKQCAEWGQPPSNKPADKGAGMAVSIAFEGELPFSGSADGPVGVSFSPDGRTLAVIAPDRSVRLWDIAARKEIGSLRGPPRRCPGGPLCSQRQDVGVGQHRHHGPAVGCGRRTEGPGPARADRFERPRSFPRLWNDLAGADAAGAHQGVRKLAAGAKHTLPFLSTHLKPAAWVQLKQINGWIADLDNEKFSVRQEAMAKLLKVGQQAVAPLMKLLASGPQLETRRRMEDLVDRLTSSTLTPEQLRIVRAVDVLERIGTPEARRLLKALAAGGPGELPTREAQAALERLAAK